MNLGGAFAGIGGGISQAMQNMQQQRDAQMRNLMLQIYLRNQSGADKLRNLQIDDLTSKHQATGIEAGMSGWSPDAGGGGAGEASGVPSGVPAGVPAPSSYAPSPGGWSSGLRTLTSLGVSPEVATGAVDYMRRNESGANPLAVNSKSGALGRAQWLGPRKTALTSQYGPQPNDDQQADFMKSELLGPERRTLDRLRADKTQKEGYDTWGRDFERPGAADLAKAGVDASPTQIAQTTSKAIDPFVWGRMARKSLAAQIEKQFPNASAAAKSEAFDHLAKTMLAPEETRRWEMFKLDYEKQQQRGQAQFQSDVTENRERRMAPFNADIDIDKQRRMAEIPSREGTKMFTLSDGTRVAGVLGQPDSFKTMTGQPLSAAQKAMMEQPNGITATTAGSRAGSKNVEVTDAEGKIIFSGSAHQTPEGWVGDKDQKPVAVPDDGSIKIIGTGGQGRQAAAQIQSMIGSTSELVGEVRNLMELPSTSVAGLFQGLQAVPADKLGDAVKRALANKLTPEDQIDLTTSFQGVSRALATIEAQGRATGLVGLTAMSQGLMPQTGDTQGNILRKYATIRQIAERNTDAIEASPNATAEQKALLKKLRGEIQQTVPFTVAEVNKLQHGDAETVMQAAKRFGLAGGAAAPGGVAVPADHANDPDGTSYKGSDGKTYIKRGNQMVPDNARPDL